MTNPERDKAIQKIAQTFMEDDMDDPIWPDEAHMPAWDACVADLTDKLTFDINDLWVEFREQRKAAVS